MTQFDNSVLSQPCVKEVHHTHSWSIDAERHVLTMHVVVSAEADHRAIVAIKEHVRHLLGPDVFEHIAIDVEYENEACLASGESVRRWALTGTGLRQEKRIGRKTKAAWSGLDLYARCYGQLLRNSEIR